MLSIEFVPINLKKVIQFLLASVENTVLLTLKMDGSSRVKNSFRLVFKVVDLNLEEKRK